MQRVRAHELRAKDENALVEELTKHRKDLAALRVSKVSSQPQVKLSKIRVSVLNSHGLVCQKGHRQSPDCTQRKENCLSPHCQRKGKAHTP